MTTVQTNPLDQMLAREGNYADELIDRYAQANPPAPAATPIPGGPPTQYGISAVPPESFGESMVKSPGRLLGSMMTELIVRPAQRLDYAVQRIAGALGFSDYAAAVKRDSERIGRENRATTLGSLGEDTGVATFVGQTAGTVLKWSIPAIGATDTALAAHQQTYEETGSDKAAFGSAAIHTIAAFAGFKIAQKFSPKLAENVGSLCKEGNWIAGAQAVGQLSKGAGSVAGLEWAGMFLDEQQKVAMGAQNEEQAWENIKDKTIPIIAGGALGGAMMTGGGAIHEAFKTKVNEATNTRELAEVVHEAIGADNPVQNAAKEAQSLTTVVDAAGSPVPGGTSAAARTPPGGSAEREFKPGEAGTTERPPAAMGAAALSELGPGPTSVKNAVTAAERERRGLPPAAEAAPESITEWDAEAKKTLENNPTAGTALVQDVLATERPLTDRETAVLLNHQAKVQNEFDDTAWYLAKAKDEGDLQAVEDLTARHAALSDELLDIYNAGKLAGTQWGRGGVARQMMMNQDFSLAAMETRARASVGGRNLTSEERADVTAQHKAIAESDKALEDHLIATDERAAARQGDREITRLAKDAKREAKSDAKPKTKDEILAGIEVDAQPTDAELSNIARELAKYFIRQGMKDRNEIVDAVHGELKAVLPEITPRQVADAISLYGQYKLLNRDPIAVKLREVAGELQQVSKLQDMEAGQAPRKTGVERREPTDEERRLIKQVNEKKKEAGFDVTDPARQLKSALDAVKTRLRNSIKDLAKQIQDRQKIVKTKKALKYDAEANTLKAERDALKEQYDAVFGKSKMSDEQRLAAATKAVERSIADLEQRIASKDFGKGESKAVSDANLESLKAKRDALRDQFDELKSLDPASMRSEAERSLAQYKRHLSERSARLRDRLAKQDFHRRTGQKSRLLDAEGKLLADENARLKAQFTEGLLNSRMRESMAAQIAEMKGQIRSGTLPEPKVRKEPRALPPDVRRLKFERDRLKAIQERQRSDKEASVWKRAWRATGLMRLLMTTGEFSFILRQGFPRMLGHPLKTARSTGKSLKAFASKAYAAEQDLAIFNRDNAHLYERDGLKMIHPEEGLSGTEEIYFGSWADKIPGIKQFNRAARVFLNEIRADSYDTLAASIGREPTAIEGKAIANFVGAATGRGNLGKMEAVAGVLNETLFSARFLASRFQYLTAPATGFRYGGGTRATRLLIAKEYARTFIGLTVFYGLAAAAGADIEIDPRSTDFLKLRFGKTRLDPLAGFQQFIVLGARLGTGEKKTLSGKVQDIRGSKIPYGGDDAVDVLKNFIRSKAAPIPATALNLLSGRNVAGEPTDLGTEAMRTSPITYWDIYKAMRDQDVPAGSALSITAFFGMGLQTYDERQQSTSDIMKRKF